MASAPVEGIRAIEAKPSLLTSARKTPFGYDVWRSGITFRDTALLIGGRWPYSPGSSHDDKADAVPPQLAEFIPFTVYLPVTCDELTYSREDDLTAEAIVNAEANTAWEVGRELWTGATVNDAVADNPSLQLPFPSSVFTGSHILSGPVNPVNGLGLLVQAYEDGTHKGGVMIHVPAVLIPYLLDHFAITQQGSVYIGPSGSVVVPGPGYPAGSGAYGPKTSAAPNGTTATAGQVWMYATGPVEYDLTPIRILPEEERNRWAERRTNLWQVWAERQAIVRFDPSAVWAVLTTVPTAA